MAVLPKRAVKHSVIALIRLTELAQNTVCFHTILLAAWGQNVMFSAQYPLLVSMRVDISCFGEIQYLNGITLWATEKIAMHKNKVIAW